MRGTSSRYGWWALPLMSIPDGWEWQAHCDPAKFTKSQLSAAIAADLAVFQEQQRRRDEHAARMVQLNSICRSLGASCHEVLPPGVLWLGSAAAARRLLQGGGAYARSSGWRWGCNAPGTMAYGYRPGQYRPAAAGSEGGRTGTAAGGHGRAAISPGTGRGWLVRQAERATHRGGGWGRRQQHRRIAAARRGPLCCTIVLRSEHRSRSDPGRGCNSGSTGGGIDYGPYGSSSTGRGIRGEASHHDGTGLEHGVLPL